MGNYIFSSMENAMKLPYMKNRFLASRRKSLEVKIGDLLIGGKNPIAIQSMTNTNTRDIEATVKQSLSLARAGCELVRITAPTAQDAACLKEIVKKVREEGIQVPFCADIHFQPKAAFEAVKWVEKVRVNPGNFVDTKTAAIKEYNDKEFEKGLQKVFETFGPLVREAQKNGVALRIGTNHGSLSDRILFRYGDTVEGMVESALEFARVCEAENFHQMVFSMKSSNPKVVIQAYRLLAARLDAEHKPYPFHLGVTEAGDGEDGRLKSAAGIGALLLDGLGDTIRVSLTEAPEAEIPVAKMLRDVCSLESIPHITSAVSEIGEKVSFYGEILPEEDKNFASFNLGGLKFGPGQKIAVGTILKSDDVIPNGKRPLEWATSYDLEKDPGLPVLFQGIGHCDFAGGRGVSSSEWMKASKLPEGNLEIIVEDLQHLEFLRKLITSKSRYLWSLGETVAGVAAYRYLAAWLSQNKLYHPIALRFYGNGSEGQRLKICAEASSLFCDGIGQALHLSGFEPAQAVDFGYDVLQAASMRRSKTEYVSCPSCGRTLFDLETTTEKIRKVTSHLADVSIAIMGCIVNGPGEMADADFGYVGGAPGKVNLYVGRDCVKRAVPEDKAAEELIELIKTHGRWVEPETEASLQS